MTGHSAFGTFLREAREHKGIGLKEVSRRLHVSEDILRAIEDSDIAHIPPQGYARNMVSTYARYLGLNSTEVTTLYLEAVRRYQMGSSYDGGEDQLENLDSAGGNRVMFGRENAARSRRDRSYSQPEESGRVRGSRRERRDRRSGDSQRTTSRAARGSASRDSQSRKDRQASLYGNNPDRLTNPRANSNIFAESLPKKIMRKLPMVIIVAVIVALLVFIASSAMSCMNANKVQQATTIPITGMSDTTNSNTANANGNANNGNTNTAKKATNEPAPTYATVQYSVTDDRCAYIELYKDGSSEPSFAEAVYGPETDTFQVETTLTIVTTAPENVTVTVDGSEVHFSEDSQGVYSCTVNFSDILETWKKEHGTETGSNTNKSSN